VTRSLLFSVINTLLDLASPAGAHPTSLCREGGGWAEGSNKYVEPDENFSKCDNNTKYRYQ